MPSDTPVNVVSVISPMRNRDRESNRAAHLLHGRAGDGRTAREQTGRQPSLCLRTIVVAGGTRELRRRIKREPALPRTPPRLSLRASGAHPDAKRLASPNSSTFPYPLDDALRRLQNAENGSSLAPMGGQGCPPLSGGAPEPKTFHQGDPPWLARTLSGSSSASWWPRPDGRYPKARVNRLETDDKLRARIERLSDATGFAFG